jgi:hypothetical protein
MVKNARIVACCFPLPLSLMSSLFSVSGFLALKSHDPSPSRLHQSRQLPGATYHLFYESEILCGKYKSMLAVIRKDSPPSKKALPNNTMAYIVAKFHVPASLCVGPVLLEASEITPIHLMSTHFSEWK